ncbi:MAG: hypothetical protein NT128_04375 [Proteobacteria bacterium]|nr:hypothetical protein [Pseudomonadota bacterium]
MRGLSKVAILSVAVIAIGGQLFAPPPGAAAYQQSNRDEFVRRSTSVIAHEWKTEEIDEFNRTNVIPSEIGSKFTYTQLVECLKGLEQTLEGYHRDLLERLRSK